jgi:hypothetical protein
MFCRAAARPRYDRCMSFLPRLGGALTPHWPDLAAELDQWGEAGRVAVLWWRDDDAVGATAPLADLLRLAGPVPVALAVVPALARPDLATALASAPAIGVLQHGWQHADRAAAGRKSEYPDGRGTAIVAAEVAAGRARLRALFGPSALPLFVPPWNRFAPALLPVLAESGMAGLSTMAGRRPAALPAGLAALDVHVDVVDWRGDRGFVGTAAALSRLIGCLRAQRLGATAAAGPIGILTHHLVMDRATAEFLGCLAARILSHSAARWADSADLLP